MFDLCMFPRTMKSCGQWAFMALLAVGGVASTRAQTPHCTLTKLYDTTDGRTFGTIVLAGDGNLYGIAYGTAFPDHTIPPSVFQLTPAGTLTTLHQFTGTEGPGPSSLIVGRDGNLYGTTANFNSAVSGTIFRLTPAGGFTTLHEFAAATDAYPGGLFQASDGDFYGYTGGYSPNGETLFRLTPGGEFSVLYRFPIGDDASSFIQTRDGDFFGSALQNNLFGIFQLMPDGTITTINDPKKSGSLFNLLQSTDGNFYGLSLYFFKEDNGPPENTLVRITPDGQRTAYFLQPEYGTVGDMIQGQDGNFYISAVEDFGGGLSVGGAIESATPKGNSNAVYAFPPPLPNYDSDYPTSGVIQAGDGSFYGTASGTVDSYIYRLTASFPAVTLSAVIPKVIAGSGDNGKAQVTLSGPWPFDLNVYYKVRGDATPISDYKATLGGVLTIPAGQTSAFIKIRPGTHQGRDGTKTVRLKLSPGGAYTVGASTVAKIVIRAESL